MNYRIILLVFKNVKFGVILKSSRTIILSILIIFALSLSLGAISAQAIDDDSTGIMIDVDGSTKNPVTHGVGVLLKIIKDKIFRTFKK